jgi:pyruvate/2-oxoglutarate/acetoin dehydrogenase E1 component
MIYRDAITAAMRNLADDPLVKFYGYGLRTGRAMGTLKYAEASALIETPVAENLMVGLATGAALTGVRPVVYIERADFLLCCADAIVNHTDKLDTMSRGEFSAGVIFRVTVGNKRKPLFTGETHTQNFAEAFRSMLKMPVIELHDAEQIGVAYQDAHEAMTRGRSTMLFEFKDEI